MSQQSSIKYTVAAGLWTILTLVLLFLPERELDPLEHIDLPHLDKLVHVVLFGVLTFLLKKALVERTYFMTDTKLIGLLAVFAVMTEILQRYSEGRSTDLMDFIADMIGVCSALLIVKYWK